MGCDKVEVLDNKCPACGAKITFNPKNQMWDCEYCGSKFTLEEMKKHNNASNKEANDNKEYPQKKDKFKTENIDSYRCKSCAAEVLADENTTATFCVYCGNTAILKEKITNSRVPSKIIPFKKVKEDAVTAFKNISKGKPLMPKLFNNQQNIEKISGVYIPFWTYDLQVKGNIEFNCIDIKSWSDYNYQYTKKDIYLSKRSASMNFYSILVDASSRFDDNLMDSIEPFDYKELTDYNHAYLSGFLAEKYDVESNKALERANLRAMNTAIEVTENTVIHQTKTIANNNLEIKELETDYILLPVWMVNIKYKNKYYTFAMNGQTGKIIGDIPIDIGKTILLTMIIFTSFFLLFFLIIWFVG